MASGTRPTRHRRSRRRTTWATPPPGSAASDGDVRRRQGRAHRRPRRSWACSSSSAWASLLLGSEDDSSSDVGTEIAPTTAATDDVAAGTCRTATSSSRATACRSGLPEGWEGISPEDVAMSAEEFEQAFPDAARGDARARRGRGRARGPCSWRSTSRAVRFDNVNIIEIPARIELVADGAARPRRSSPRWAPRSTASRRHRMPGRRRAAGRVHGGRRAPGRQHRPHPGRAVLRRRRTIGPTSSPSAARPTIGDLADHDDRHVPRRLISVARRSLDSASHMSVLRSSDVTSMRSSSPWNIEP